jgi:hypothetical protein
MVNPGTHQLVVALKRAPTGLITVKTVVGVPRGRQLVQVEEHGGPLLEGLGEQEMYLLQVRYIRSGEGS